MSADILAAVRKMLLDDIAIADMVDDRIYNATLPRTEDASMPRKNIVLSLGGSMLSAGSNSYIQVQRLRVDIRVYGEDPYEARKVYRSVESFFKAITPTVVSLTSHSIYVHNAVESVGPIEMVDPDTDWPSVVGTWGVHASEVEIAPSAGVSS